MYHYYPTLGQSFCGPGQVTYALCFIFPVHKVALRVIRVK